MARWSGYVDGDGGAATHPLAYELRLSPGAAALPSDGWAPVGIRTSFVIRAAELAAAPQLHALSVRACSAVGLCTAAASASLMVLHAAPAGGSVALHGATAGFLEPPDRGPFGLPPARRSAREVRRVVQLASSRRDP